jgi:hypothetical protein
MVWRGGWSAGRSFQAAPARHSHHSACSITSVDQSLGRPVPAGGSIASMMAARRASAFARTIWSMAGA